MPRTFSLRRDGRTRRVLFDALGMVAPLTHDLNPPERRTRLFQQWADALGAEAVALWARTRRRIVLLTDEAPLVIAPSASEPWPQIEWDAPPATAEQVRGLISFSTLDRRS